MHVGLVVASGLIYIVPGPLALERAPIPAARRLNDVAALGVYLFMASVAMAQHPLGFLQTALRHGGLSRDERQWAD